MVSARERLEGAYGPAGDGHMRSGAPWPAPMHEQAFHGLAGEFVRLVDPVTEADPHGLLMQFLAAVGNAVGRSVGAMADGSLHPTLIWPVQVGRTAKARKGTSWARVREVMELACPEWAERCVVGGLSTGEGLVHQIRDQRIDKRKARKGEKADLLGFITDVVDVGVSDKRLTAVESEFTSVFRMAARDGNTLSTTLRTLWDTGQGGGLTKTDPSRVKRGHVTVIGHCTLDELRLVVSDTDISGGLVNRFLWVCVDRSKLLPEGGRVDTRKRDALVERLRERIDAGAELDRLARTRKARTLWSSSYEQLTADRPGRLGLVLGRAEAQVLRLSLVYAVLDGRETVDVEHLEAALAVWKYCERSAAYVFGDATGDELADRMIAALRRHEEGLTRSELREQVGRKRSEERFAMALDRLEQYGLARMEQETTRGRPAERWFAVKEEER
jgi:hypothetical protein